MTTILSIDLLGDSILDNASYVDSGEAVIDQIFKLSPISVSLLALDGDTTADTFCILDEMGDDPKPETGAVVSVGGNDALQNSSILMATCLDHPDRWRRIFDHKKSTLLKDICVKASSRT